ncbi:MAG: 6-bladed beta-propeller [Acidobacteriota bacterium]
MKQKKLFLFATIAIFSSFLSSYEEKVINIVGKISMFKAYKNCLYFLNSSEGNIWRFDQELKLLNKIGEKGEGPGEVSNLSNFNFLEDKIYTFSRNRLLIFGLDGTLLNEVKIPPTNNFYLLLKNGNFIEKTRDFSYEKGKTIIQKIRFLDKDFNQIIEILDERLEVTPGYQFEAIEPFISVKYSDKTDLVYISNPVRDFLIMIFDENGKQIGKVFKHCERIKVRKEYKEKFAETLIHDPHITSKQMADAFLKQLHFPKYFPPFHSFFLDDEGNVYIRTYKKKNNKTIFEKYSPKGIFLREYLLEDKYINIVDSHLFISFSAGNYYYLYEDENGDYISYREKLYKHFPTRIQR